MADKKLRVHNLAKELDVDSKIIIEKCRAEGIDVKNHMHVLTAGLAATIREWFSEGAHSTTLEEASRVDLQKIRTKPRAKKSIAGASGEEGGVATIEAPADRESAPVTKRPPRRKSPAEVEAEKETKPAVAPAVAEPAVITAPSSPPSALEVTEPATRAPLVPAPALAAEAPAPAVAADLAAAGAEKAAATVEQPPPETEPMRPAVAGPQNIPKPAQLTGPKVIRIEKPEQEMLRPRPAARSTFRPPRDPAAPLVIPAAAAEEEEGESGRRGPRAKTAGAAAVPEKRAHPRRTTKDTSTEATERLREWRDRDLIERRDRLAQASGRGIGGLRAIEGKHTMRRAGQRAAPTVSKKTKVELTGPIYVKDFSRETGIAVSEMVKKLMQDHGVLATMNTTLEPELAQVIAVDYGIELSVVAAKTGLDKLAERFAAVERDNMQTRPPIVTVLGHVDHGKTSLLDRIRQTNVTAGEAGGITQHIGAYRVQVGDKWVTFVDTPGHTAFTAMRARGTKLTDVVVLVVAADDGVMPTTVEAINHARAAKTPIVVALNKTDLPHDLNKIYGQLAEHGLTPSGDWGGETDVIQTSALSGAGIPDLLTHLATLSDVLEFEADPTIPACGTVIEAERTGAMGNVARLMVQEGTLKSGNVVVCGSAYGRVRSIRDDRGRNVKSAGPSTPVEISGLSDVPSAGDRFYVVDNLQEAKHIAEEAAQQLREQQLVRVVKPTSLESMLASSAKGEIPELRVILRADMQGSVDVLKKSLSEFPDNEVKLNVLHAGVGNVTESDVVLAKASEAIVVAFHVAPEPSIQRKADDEGVDIRTYLVIYNLLDDIRAALEGLLTPEEKVESRGRAEVREVFTITRVGRIAGCQVRDGIIERSNMVRVLRDGVIVKDRGAIESLRRFKDDVKEVRNGLECGLRISNYDDLKPGDIIEAFQVIKVARKLEK